MNITGCCQQVAHESDQLKINKRSGFDFKESFFSSLFKQKCGQLFHKFLFESLFHFYRTGVEMAFCVCEKNYVVTYVICVLT